MPQEHTSPPPAQPVAAPAWLHRALLLLGVVLMTASLVSGSGVVRGLAVASGAALVGVGLGVLVSRRRAGGAAD